MTRRRRAGWARRALAAALAIGCDRGYPAALRVEVTTDIAALTSLEVRTLSQDGSAVLERGVFSWPESRVVAFNVVPRDGDPERNPDAVFELAGATCGAADGAIPAPCVAVTRRVRAAYVRGRYLPLRVALSARCQAVRGCAPRETCVEGACRDDRVWASGDGADAGEGDVRDATSCSPGRAACPSAGVARCVDHQSDPAHCGACGRACDAAASCVQGECRRVTRPANDSREGAAVIDLARYRLVRVQADTTDARHDAAGPCGCTAGNDLFYTFTLAGDEVVAVDTLDGEGWDSALFLLDASGRPLEPAAGLTTCNDDACDTRRSQLATRLGRGTYYVVLSGCGQGRARVTFQHAPVGNGSVTRFTPSGAQTFSGTTTGDGRLNPGCMAEGPEDTYWWTTCPSWPETSLHVTTCNGAAFDTVLHQYSPDRSEPSVWVCNDDGPGCGLRASLVASIPAGAGLHACYVDGFAGLFEPEQGAYTVRLAFGACVAGFERCGGACTSLQTDAANCARCGNACTGGMTCQGGTCRCPAGQTLCAGVCRNLTTDNAHCGACGAACTGAARCMSGRCM